MQRTAFIFAFALSSTCLGQIELPEGFEIVDLVSNGDTVRVPAVNNCGEIVFPQAAPEHEWEEIYHYDNGPMDRISFQGVWTWSPDINDAGTIVWAVGASDILMLRDEQIVWLGDGTGGVSINNLDHVVWDLFAPITCADECTVYFYDGAEVTLVSDSIFSNQAPELNDYDDIVWTRYDDCPSPWTYEIILHTKSGEVSLPSAETQGGTPTINNAGQVVWTAAHTIESWEEGVTTLLTDWGDNPSLNNFGDIHFIRWHDENDTWQAWYYQVSTGTPTFYRLTDDDRWQLNGDINDYGEAVWYSFASPYNPDADCGLHYLRRIRNGDVDFDGDVDLDDFATLPACMTGPVETDRLCDCRFFDMDHDRDIDLSDLTLFQGAFSAAP